MIKYVGKENFEQEVLKSEKTILVDFFATWCGPCQMLGKVLENISNQKTDFDIAKIDIDKEERISSRLSNRSSTNYDDF